METNDVLGKQKREREREREKGRLELMKLLCMAFRSSLAIQKSYLCNC